MGLPGTPFALFLFFFLVLGLPDEVAQPQKKRRGAAFLERRVPYWATQELSVLESVNWHRVKVGALVVEELQLDRDQQKNKDVRRLLKETAKLEMLGVSCWKEVACDSYWINPLLFDHEAAKAYLRRHPFPSEKYRVKPETACSKASKTVL